MKYLNILFTLFVLFSYTIHSQSGALGGSDSNPNSQHLGTTAGIYLLNSSSKSKIAKIFLFNSFQNDAVIFDANSKKYKISNFNIDLITNSFVSKVSKDTLFTFSSISKAVIQNREFSKMNNFIHEKLAEGDKINFYIKHFSKRKEKEVDKMNGKLIKPEHYVSKLEYILIDEIKKETISLSRLRKKKVISLLNEDYRSQVITYAKKNKLSFKDKIDLKQILQYYNSI